MELFYLKVMVLLFRCELAHKPPSSELFHPGVPPHPTNATSHNRFPLALCAKAVQCGEAVESLKAPLPNPKPVLTTITVELRDATPTHCMTYGYVYIAGPSK